MRPLFILGAPRSGTSLLSRMLDNHPAIADRQDKIFEAFVPLLPLYGDLGDRARLRRLVDNVVGWRWIRRLPSPTADEAVLAKVAEPDMGGVFEAMLGCWTEPQGKPRWGEKSPNNLLYWDGSKRLPRCRGGPHRPRRPRRRRLADRAPFGPKTMAPRPALGPHQPNPRHRRALGPSRYVEIRYEDLLAARSDHHRGAGPGRRAVRSLDAGVPRAARPVGTDPVNDRNIHKPLQAETAANGRPRWVG